MELGFGVCFGLIWESLLVMGWFGLVWVVCVCFGLIGWFVCFFSSALSFDSGLAFALIIWVQLHKISDTFGIPWTAPESITQH